MSERSAYTFGAGDVAAHRLALVAAVFEQPTRGLLTRAAEDRNPPRLALDLGCGPGHSTALLAEVVAARRTVGIDAAPDFVERARRAHPSIEFAIADVLGPLPHPGAAVVLCRLLLSHLPDPPAVVARWVAQLRPGARLVLEEVEHIHGNHPVLDAYEDLVVELVASRGADMYAGPLLHAMPDRGWRRRHDDLRTWAVSHRDAATMFAMNLSVWRDDPAIRARHDRSELDDLASALGGLAASGDGDAEWGIRQMILEVR